MFSSEGTGQWDISYHALPSASEVAAVSLTACMDLGCNIIC
jgi:hypothetical protein